MRSIDRFQGAHVSRIPLHRLPIALSRLDYSYTDTILHYAQIAHIGIEPMISTLKVWRLNLLPNAPQHQYTMHCIVCNTCINEWASNMMSNKNPMGITQEWGENKRDGRVPSLRCDSNTVLRRLFFSRIARQKPLNIAFSELKLCMSFQIRRLLHWFNLAALHKCVKCCAANMQSTQDLFCAQQFIVTHTTQKPFCTSWTKRTFLTRCLYKVYNINIIHDQENFCNAYKRQSPSKTQKNNAGLSQRIEKILVAVRSPAKPWKSEANDPSTSYKRNAYTDYRRHIQMPSSLVQSRQIGMNALVATKERVS